MRTEKLDILLAGFTAFVVMAGVLVVWGLVRHRPVIEYRPEGAGYLPYTGPEAAVPDVPTIHRAPETSGHRAPAAARPAAPAAPATPPPAGP